MPTRPQGQGRAAPRRDRREPRPGRETDPRCLPFVRRIHPGESARWRIDGWPVDVLVWTAAEVKRLPEPPADAQCYPEAGVWVALRLAEGPI